MLLSIFKKEVGNWTTAELVSNLLTMVVRLIAGNWKTAYNILLSEWYMEAWDIAINKLSMQYCLEGVTGRDVLIDIWGEYRDLLSIKWKGERPMQKTIQF